MALFTLGLISMNTGCEDRIDSPEINPSEDKTVEVMLNIGIADEITGTTAKVSPATKVNAGSSGSAWDVVSTSNVHTKTTVNKPGLLYNLEIIQYKADGSVSSQILGNQSIGAAFAVTLTATNNCRLLIVARGNNADFGSLSGKSLSQVQELKVNAKNSKINGIPTDATSDALANMPYFLFLEGVNIVNVGGQYKIQSSEGKDVRLLLKRLAVKLTVDWTFNSKMTESGYVLKEVKLCQVPADYRLIPQTETTENWGEVYPTSEAEFIDPFRLTGDALVEANNTKSLWIPANSRGTSPYVTSPFYRYKDNANPAATYMEFVVDNSSKKERLYYRAYLGGNETNDFNLLENTDYHWTININNANYASDRRIQLLDQTAVESANLQSTANCFMMKPGTNICFNPYKHTAGTNGWNDRLVDTSTGTPAIKYTIDKVKILWQTKDAGTVGDLIMGYVIDEDNHENLVNLTQGDQIDNARIHVKVPTTKGGNAVIAAYSGGSIVWSWHIWVTDYEPKRINCFAEYEAAQAASRNGTVHKYDSPLFQQGGVYENMVLMDRNLGARTGGYPALTTGKGTDFSTMDVVNTYGLLYQWGRKDPFFNSLDGTNNEKDVIYDGYGMPVNIDKVPMSRNVGDKMDYSIANPLAFYYANGSDDWYSPADGRWNAVDAENKAPGKKGLHDPCPVGWKIPMMCDQTTTSVNATFAQEHTIFTNFGQTVSNGIVINRTNNYKYSKFLCFYKGTLDGNIGNIQYPRLGRLFFINNTTQGNMTIDNTVWIPATAERAGHASTGAFNVAAQYGHLWLADQINNLSAYLGFYGNNVQIDNYHRRVAWPVRCIQE